MCGLWVSNARGPPLSFLMMILKSHLSATAFALAVCKVSSLHLNQGRVNTVAHPNVYICLGAWLKGLKRVPGVGSAVDRRKWTQLARQRSPLSTGLGALLSLSGRRSQQRSWSE